MPTADAILAQVLNLEESERHRVYAVLRALYGGEASSVPQLRSEGASPNNPYAPPEVTDQDELHSVKMWYESLGSDATDFERINLIDEAILETDHTTARNYLERKRREIMDDRPGVAVRVAVTRIATRQPWMVVGALTGAVLGTVSLFRWLLRVLF